MHNSLKKKADPMILILANFYLFIYFFLWAGGWVSQSSLKAEQTVAEFQTFVKVDEIDG